MRRGYRGQSFMNSECIEPNGCPLRCSLIQISTKLFLKNQAKILSYFLICIWLFYHHDTEVHPGRANNRAGRFSRQRYEPYPQYQPHYAPPVYVPAPIQYAPPVPAPVPISKSEPRDQLTATLKMYCADDVIERVLNTSAMNSGVAIDRTMHNNNASTTGAINSDSAEQYQPDVQSDSDQETAEQFNPIQNADTQVPSTQMTPVSQSSAQTQSVTGVTARVLPSPIKVSAPRHVPVVIPKKAISHPTRPVTATVVNMTPQQKQIQLKLAPVQIVPYEGGKSLKFPYDPIEWPKTPKQYVLEWFQRQSSLRVNKQLALIDPQRAAAMSQAPCWEKVAAPALRQGLHLVTLHVTDPRTLRALTFTPDRYWSTVKEAEHVASLLFLQYLLPQANSAKEIHEAMENMQRQQKRLNSSTGPVTRKSGAVPADKVGKEIYSAVPPTTQPTESTRAPDAAPAKQYLDTRPHLSNANTPTSAVTTPPIRAHPMPANHNTAPGYYPMYHTGYYYPPYYSPYPGYSYPYPPQ